MNRSLVALLSAAPLALFVSAAEASLLPRSAARGSQSQAGQKVSHAPVAWRLCPGTEESTFVRSAASLRSGAAPGPNLSLKVSLRLTPSLPGCQVTGERLGGGEGGGSWLVHLRVPAGARPGRYAGTLVLSGGPTLIRQPAAVELLPFELMRPSKQYSVTQVPTAPGRSCAPEQAEPLALRRLRDLGIGCLCLAAPVDRTALEGKMQAAGLRGPVLLPIDAWAGSSPPAGEAGGSGSSASPAHAGAASATPPSRAVSSASRVRWYALFSSPPSPERAAALRAGGALIACRVAGSEATAGIDLPIFNASGTDGVGLIAHDGAPTAGTSGWWQWDAGAATALENRLRCGALLWKTGLSGALVEINPAAAAEPDWALRWEGVCQGVQDSRYLTTLFSLIRQVKDKDRSSPLPGKAEVAIAAALNSVAERPSPTAAVRVRETAIAWIVRLGRLVWS